MKRLFSLLFFIPLFVYSQEGIKFEETATWKQVLQKAKAENKYIFVDCYATWCGPCKYMDKSVYTQENVGSYYNKNFISVKVQMDTAKLDNDLIKGWYADASKIQKTYKVNSFPTYLFFSPGGDLVHRDVGGKAPEQFMVVGADALNPEKQYYVALQKYRRNALDKASMKALARKVKAMDGEELAGKIANEYINRLPIDELFTQDNIQFMYEFTKSSKDRGFVIFKDSAKRISGITDRINENTCKNLVLSIINNEAIKPYRFTKKGKADWEKISSSLKKYGSIGEEALIANKPGIIFITEIEPTLKVNSNWDYILPLIQSNTRGISAEFVVGSSVVYYLNAINVHHTEKTCKNFVAAATYYADSFSTFLSADALNSWAWTLFENSKEKDELNTALKWSKRSNELEPDSPELLDTYANILYKLGLVNDAISWQQKAVAVADAQAQKRNGNAMPVFKESLEKMKNGEKTWPER